MQHIQGKHIHISIGNLEPTVRHNNYDKFANYFNII